MADEEKKEGISTKLFGKKKKLDQESEMKSKEEAMVMEEPSAMVMEEPPAPKPPATPVKPTSKLAGHPVARRKHRSILNQRPVEARKYLGTK